MQWRLLEGEAYVYKGVLYLAKGYQHPEGMVVAYPRYSAIDGRKLAMHEREIHSSRVYWDCIKHSVSVIPRERAYVYSSARLPGKVEYIKHLLESLLEVELYPTGSAIVSEEPGDVDLVVYGASHEVVERLKRLLDRGILKAPLSLIVQEYLKRHFKAMNLEEYLYLKKNTVLHGYLGNIHVNFKLVEFSRGFEGCVEPVEDVVQYTGWVEVIEALNPHRIPARYLAVSKVGGVLVESLRELYAELTPGRYIAVNARVEMRKSGLYLVPDHGVLKPLQV